MKTKQFKKLLAGLALVASFLASSIVQATEVTKTAIVDVTNVQTTKQRVPIKGFITSVEYEDFLSQFTANSVTFSLDENETSTSRLNTKTVNQFKNVKEGTYQIKYIVDLDKNGNLKSKNNETSIQIVSIKRVSTKATKPFDDAITTNKVVAYTVTVQ